LIGYTSRFALKTGNFAPWNDLLNGNSTYLYVLFISLNFMIKNLIFDFGGVIIDIEPIRVGQSFREMGVKNIEKVHKLAISRGLYLDLEKGLITPAVFRDGMRDVSGLKFTDEQIDNAWNSMIINLPKSRFDLLRQLKENYNVYLLSNTNEIHYNYFNQYCVNHLYVKCLDDFFTGCFYSHKMKMRKPDLDIYIKMLESGKINPSESLYFDDLEENILAGRKLGIQGIVHQSGEEIDQYFVDGWLRDCFI
jgi:glucose-1-phosphatase